MDEFAIIDKRKHRYITIDRSIILAYSPFIGSKALHLYLLYITLGVDGDMVFSKNDISNFLNISQEEFDEANRTLEEYGLIKIETRERDGKIVNICNIIETPAVPKTIQMSLRKKALVVGLIDDMIQASPAQQDVKKKSRRTLITPMKLITKFYSLLGNGDVDIFEREAGKRHINRLMEQGYSLDDIDFAIEWCFENVRNELHDLSSLLKFIDRAINERDEYLSKREQQTNIELEAREDDELERKMIESYKKMMPDNERKALRQRALDMILQDKRINPEFVTEHLIAIKENEIVREEFLRKTKNLSSRGDLSNESSD